MNTPTASCMNWRACISTCCRNPTKPMLQRHNLKWKAKLESRISCFRFKRLVPGGFNRGVDRVNLHRHTMPSHPSTSCSSNRKSSNGAEQEGHS